MLRKLNHFSTATSSNGVTQDLKALTTCPGEDSSVRPAPLANVRTKSLWPSKRSVMMKMVLSVRVLMADLVKTLAKSRSHRRIWQTTPRSFNL